MNKSIVVDWKFVLALGASVAGLIFASKMDPFAIENVSIHLIDTAKEYAIAFNSNR